MPPQPPLLYGRLWNSPLISGHWDNGIPGRYILRSEAEPGDLPGNYPLCVSVGKAGVVTFA